MKGRPLAARAALVVVMAAAAGCSALLAVDDLSKGGGGGAPDATTSSGDDAPGTPGDDDAPTGDDASIGGGDDVGNDATNSLDAGADADAACPGTAGPTMARVGSFCIDTTEVTRNQYLAFLTATASTTTASLLPAYCAWDTTFVPTKDWPPGAADGTLPVAYVDWCDAYAYCAWAGKRLCGHAGGGPVGFSTAWKDPAQDEWMFACTHAGINAFPYGAAYQPSTCNTSDSNLDSGLTAAVGSYAGCVGGFPGLFDMSGNVTEYEDSCATTTADAGDLCRARGGAADNAASGVGCASGINVPRSYASPHKGIRCCAE